MTYLLTYHWPWMLLAALVGFGMGWISVVQRNLGLSDMMMKKYAVLIGALILASLFRLFPGRVGYWLDLALVMFVVYLVGCVAGSWLRHQVVSRIAPKA
jgi:hypothetical protein